MNRVKPPTEAKVSTPIGSTACWIASHGPAPGGASPPAGNHPKVTENNMIAIKASQKGGALIPAKQDRFTT